MTQIDMVPVRSLRTAIEKLLSGVSLSSLRKSSIRLTESYRGGSAGGSPIQNEMDRLAYVAARLPATHAATRSVLRELASRCPDVSVGSLLELGAGPSPGLWAASEVFSNLSCASHVEVDPGMADISRRLLADVPGGFGVDSTWFERNLTDGFSYESHDLVLLGYVLGELPDSTRERVVDEAWSTAKEAVVIIEPGTPGGASRVIAARTRLLARGGIIAAPCPHGGPCPLPTDDWCHFGSRVNRSREHRLLKGGSLPFEDEKFAYVVMVRESANQCSARVLRRPTIEPRRVELRLCGVNGLRRELVTRRQRESYREARKTRWGDTWESRNDIDPATIPPSR